MLRVFQARPTRLGTLFCVCAVLFAGTAGVHAQTRRGLPDGITLGPWIISPYMTAGYEVDSNIFRNVEGSQIEDQLTDFTIGVDALLPFRNSLLQLSYEGSKLEYENNVFTQDTSHSGYAQALFNFSTTDNIRVLGSLVKSFSDLRNVDEGGELVFDGKPYTYTRFDFEVFRAKRGRQGYSARFGVVDLEYEETEEVVPFFNYNGFDSSFEYRYPLPSNKWLIGYYGRRRLDNEDPNAETTEPFRREVSDTLQLGLRGYLGKSQPFVVRVGYGTFSFEGIEDSTDFQGLAGFAEWELEIGGKTELSLAVNRRPLPSSFDTHYINMQAEADIEREWLRYSTAGLRLLVGMNRYADPVPILGCETIRRVDERVEVEAYGNWLVHRRFGFEVSAGYFHRDSNCEQSTYDALVISTGIVLGWF